MTCEKYSYILCVVKAKGVVRLQQYTLKELRARKNMTQAAIAREIGVSTQTYNAWEKNISNVAIGKVEVLANFFGVTIGQIFLNQT